MYVDLGESSKILCQDRMERQEMICTAMCQSVAGIKDAVVSTFAVSKIHSFPHNGHRLKKTDLSGSKLACVTSLRDIEHM